MLSLRRQRVSLRFVVVVVVMAVAAFGSGIGCGRLDRNRAAAPTTGKPARQTRGRVEYPDTPQAVFHAARKAATEGAFRLYLSYVTKEAIERTAAGYLYAAGTGQPPLDVTPGPDYRERIAVIREILQEKGAEATDVQSAYYDPEAQARILRKFASPGEFVSEVMGRMDPQGDKDLLTIEGEHWSVQGDTAEVICDVPGGDFRTVPFRKVDGRWKVDR